MTLGLVLILAAQCSLILLTIHRLRSLFAAAEQERLSNSRAQYIDQLRLKRAQQRHISSQKVKPNQYIKEYIENVFDQRPVLANSNAQADQWLKISYIKIHASEQGAHEYHPAALHINTSETKSAIKLKQAC